MNNAELLKLSNLVAMKVIKNDFPINGSTVIKMIIEDNQVKSIEVKNTKQKGDK